MQNKERNILIISYSYYPAISPRAFRWTSICEHWAQNGIGVDVVCAYAQSGLFFSEQVNGVNIHRINDPSQRFKPVDGSQAATPIVKPEPSKTAQVKKITQKVLKSLARSLRWPDRSWLWIPPAYLHAKNLMKNGKYDYLITVSHPFSGHLVGKRIKSLFPDIKWLVDIGDPFAFAEEMPLNNFSLYRNFNYRSEKSVFEHADRVAVTNERTSERYIEFFGFHLADKIHVIGPLVDYSFLDSPSGIAKNYDEISLMFAGNLVNPVRKPDIFLSWALGLLVAWNGRKPKIFFDIYGDSALNLHKYLPKEKSLEGLRLHGQIPKTNVVDAMKRADILVNCGNITDYQLPSKIYEYMATGKPIINFVLNPKDTSVHAMKNYPSVLNVLAEEADHDAVVRFIESQMRHPVLEDSNRCIDIVQSYSTISIADRYLEVLR